MTWRCMTRLDHKCGPRLEFLVLKAAAAVRLFPVEAP